MEATMALAVASAGQAIFSGVAAKQQADAEANAMKVEARAAETRAIQRDAYSREELNRTLGGIRAARAVNGLNVSSPTARALMDEANTVVSNDRLVQVSNERAEAQSLRAAAKGRQRSGRFALAGGLLKGGISLGQGAYNSGYFD